MRLISDWRRVFRRAWSVRLIALAAVLTGAEIALPLLEGLLPLPPRTFALLSGLAAAGAFIARFVAQPEIHEEK